jgi:hypothetical protein
MSPGIFVLCTDPRLLPAQGLFFKAWDGLSKQGHPDVPSHSAAPGGCGGQGLDGVHRFLLREADGAGDFCFYFR